MNAKKIFLGLLDTIIKVVFIIVVAMLIVRYAKLAYDYGYHIFNQTAVSSGTGRTVSVIIADGDSAGEIGEKLFSVGLITDKTLFRLQEMFSDYHGMEKAGTYELSTTMTPEEMLAAMSGGENSDDTTVADDSSESSVAEESSEASAENSEEVNGG
ncbi:MAG: endolytic transglycosylase MltG [Butyrivibrio sp.]|uniref:endolytic transglycosylase MltG n=1 Tax=Butyrivibrio sp. TaxID=28121 RepID=UPI001B0AAE66|nr:endolytic transglycosylase MltG [Butyrivibrio sp.]MBO6242618.1 endolytic transglycosylase MltG [Butyrivibrio sp.]